VDLEDIADKTEGFVGADIESLCREAGIMALREDMKATKVKKKHFERSLSKARPSVDEGTIKFYEMIGKELEGGIAKREFEKAPGETGYA
jgi:transitional endoplasmic reticulum ATPase